MSVSRGIAYLYSLYTSSINLFPSVVAWCEAVSLVDLMATALGDFRSHTSLLPSLPLFSLTS